MSQPDDLHKPSLEYFSVAMSGASPEGQQAVMVPAFAGTLAPPVPDRIRRLRRHLVESMRAEREMKHPERAAGPVTSDPAGFVGEVVRAACTLCQGWCCKKGGEHAYLDERTMARVRRARPELDARGIIRLYVEAAASPAFAGSCVFHGAQGCTLDRSLRSEVCNTYFCSGLGALVKQDSPPDSVMIMAAEGQVFRTSPVLTRSDRT